MNLTRRSLMLALSLTPGVGGKTLTRIVTRNDLLSRSVAEFLRLGVDALKEEYGLTTASAKAWVEGREEILLETEQTWGKLEALGVQLISAADPEYPVMIDEMHANPPGLLYVYGNSKLLNSKTFTVLASRNVPSGVLDRVEAWSEQGVMDHRILVGGHDTPAYQRAAVVPLRWGAARILVLDKNLFEALGPDLKEEPFRAARLWRYMFDPQTDLAVSLVPPLRPAHSQSNKERDGLIACLAKSLDFAWVSSGGNMARLAAQALKAGRQVRVFSECPMGEQLIKLGAAPLPLTPSR